MVSGLFSGLGACTHFTLFADVSQPAVILPSRVAVFLAHRAPAGGGSRIILAEVQGLGLGLGCFLEAWKFQPNSRFRLQLRRFCYCLSGGLAFPDVVQTRQGKGFLFEINGFGFGLSLDGRTGFPDRRSSSRRLSAARYGKCGLISSN